MLGRWVRGRASLHINSTLLLHVHSNKTLRCHTLIPIYNKRCAIKIYYAWLIGLTRENNKCSTLCIKNGRLWLSWHRDRSRRGGGSGGARRGWGGVELSTALTRWQSECSARVDLDLLLWSNITSWRHATTRSMHYDKLLYLIQA